ncbi:MAG: hypothetical protein WC795_00155 [Candidatus Paceibacterota bacterium]|jgi:hypothetical protein
MNTHNKFFKWALIIGIMIVLNLFFNYTLSLVYSEPDYNAYFPREQVVNPPTNQQDCIAQGGGWTVNTYPVYTDAPQMKAIPTQPAPEGWCDTNFTNQKNFEAAQKIYDRNVFISLVVLGVLTIVAGAFLGAYEIIATSFSWGGVLSFLIASIRYWSSADKLVKVLILAAALGALIWIGIKKFGKNLQ